MKRTPAMLALAALGAAASAHAGLPRALDGSWYNPLQSGHGLTIERIDHDSALLFWHVFDPTGKPLTLYIETQIEGDTMKGEVLAPSGMRFGRFEESELALPFWGKVALAFSDCTHATLNYDSPLAGYGQGEIALTRLLPAGAHCSLQSAAGLASLAGHGATGFVVGEYGTGPTASLLRDPTYWGDMAGFVTGDGTVALHSDNEAFGPTPDDFVFIGESLPSAAGEAKLQVHVYSNGWLNAAMGTDAAGPSPAGRGDAFGLTLQTRRTRARGLMLPDLGGPGSPDGEVSVSAGRSGEGTLRPGTYPFLTTLPGTGISGSFQLEVAADLSLCVRRWQDPSLPLARCAFTGHASNGAANFEFVLSPVGQAGAASFTGAGQARYCQPAQLLCNFGLRMIGDNGHTGLVLHTTTIAP